MHTPPAQPTPTAPTEPPGGPAPATDPRGLARAVRAVARVSARRPKTTILLWILLIVGCTFAGAASGTKSLTEADSTVGPSSRADHRIADAGLRNPATEAILVRSRDASTTAAAARALQVRLRAVPEVASVQGPSGPAGAELRADGGRTVLVQAALRGDPDDAADHVAPVSRAVDAVRAAHPGTTLDQAGDGSVGKAIDTMVADDLQKAELLSVPLTLLILILAFGALVAASVPLLLGVTAVAGAMGALGVVSQIAPSGDSTGALVVLIGLAVGVDYSLFYVRREREERRRTGVDRPSPEVALEIAAATVGRAILVSGLTVMVALAGLLLTGVAIFTSMALGTILVVAIALVGSLTVLPAVLALLGDRVDKGRIPFLARRRERRSRPVADGRGGVRVRRPRRGAWERIATAVTRRPALALIAASCVLGALAVPALGMKLADSGTASLPAGIPAVEAQDAIERAFPGAPDSAELVVSGSDLGGDRAHNRLAQLGRRAAAVTGGRGPVDVTVSRDARTALLSVPMPDRGVEAGERIVHELRRDVAPTAERVAPGATALVTGSAAQSLDFTEKLQSALPLVLGFVLGLAFLLLLAVFRSARLAGTVIALNLMSIGAAYGVLVAVFQNRWAEGLLGFTSNGTVITWLPLLTFVILFGLSMDYSILVLERIREARIAGRSPRDAAAEGVAATAGTVTSAAIVMVAVFSIFATLRLLDMKEMGVGLAAAILIDATIVRGVALPAAVALLGEKGFRLPRRAAAREPRAQAAAWEDRHRAAGHAVAAADPDAR